MGDRQRQRRRVALIRACVIPALALSILSFDATPSSAATPEPLGALGQARAIVLTLAGGKQNANAADLRAAATALEGATDPTLWVDPSHVVAPSYGNTVFRDTLSAIGDLQGLSASPLLQARGLILGADRGVAQAMIAEAAGTDAGTLSSAQAELHAGDVAAFGGNDSSALDDYQLAWEDAFAGLTKLVSGAITSIPQTELAADAAAAAANQHFDLFGPSLVKDPTVLEHDGRPVVFLVGYEFCPFCGVESWGEIAALSQFGTFHHLQLVSSDPTDLVSVPAFTFRNASYSSSMLDVETVEQYSSVPDPQSLGFPYEPLQQFTPDEQQLMDTYDSVGGAPFIDIGNVFTTLGATVSPLVLFHFDWPQVIAALRDPTTLPAQGIAATTETLTAEICEVTDEHPASVCQAPVVQQYEELIDGGTGGGYCPGAVAGSVPRVTRRPSKPARVRLLPRRGKPRAHAARCSV
jgi:Domain of unknown function (DUF929)